MTCAGQASLYYQISCYTTQECHAGHMQPKALLVRHSMLTPLQTSSSASSRAIQGQGVPHGLARLAALTGLGSRRGSLQEPTWAVT